MSQKKQSPTFQPQTRQAWRTWLEKNHDQEKMVGLILYKKETGVKTITHIEAVEEALCFGWIDSKAIRRDEESRIQYFTPRKPASSWSKVNREKTEELIEAGLMRPAGQAMIDLAKKNGTWEAMIDIEKGIIPDDLQKAFDTNKTAEKNFMAFAPSSKKLILKWILDAKRPETREKRIKETVELAEKNIKANHPK